MLWYKMCLCCFLFLLSNMPVCVSPSSAFQMLHHMVSLSLLHKVAVTYKACEHCLAAEHWFIHKHSKMHLDYYCVSDQIAFNTMPNIIGPLNINHPPCEREISTSVALTYTKLCSFIPIYILKGFYWGLWSYIIHSMIYRTFCS